jgi:hypothetical protein
VRGPGPHGEVPSFEPGSFRDPHGRVLVVEGEVLRALSERGLEDWRALQGSGLLRRPLADGSLIETEELDDGGQAAARLADALPDPPAALLRHRRIRFVSYPYEWPFSMLKRAALLQLELIDAALDEGLMVKDASPYNVQWDGTRPVFVDLSSFERLREGEPWPGYRQFCMLFLYPLMLQAYRGVDFQPLLRGAIDGISPAQMRGLLSGRDLWRRGSLTHVRLHARLERSYAERQGGEVRRELKKAKFSTELIRANVRRLRKLVARLEWKAGRTVWTEYRGANTYTDADQERKLAFVAAAASRAPSELAWDLGCNDGAYARVAAEHAATVVAVDNDHATVDGLFRSLREEDQDRILPLVVNLADPSPGMGWRGLERRPLPARGTPDLVLALALVHHLSITANVPLRELVDWLASLRARTVIEFPTRDDPMVARLLSAKRDDVHDDYELEAFEGLVSERFEVGVREELPSGTRILFELTPRG